MSSFDEGRSQKKVHGRVGMPGATRSQKFSINSGVTRDDRWQNLVTGAFHLDDELASVRVRGSVARRRLAIEYLDSILEVFPSDLDPVQDFEGYAVRRLAQSLRRALHDAGTPPVARPRARPARRKP